MQGNEVGKSDEWYTPKYILDALGIYFHLDPCSPCKEHWIPCLNVFTKDDDGLIHAWKGVVFMNPPFGGRNGHVPWLRKFIAHGNGVAIVRAYTSSGWWHEFIPLVETIVFPEGKTKFIRPDGSVGQSPSQGIALLGMGDIANAALEKCALGMFFKISSP